jgi:outer membrane protein
VRPYAKSLAIESSVYSFKSALRFDFGKPDPRPYDHRSGIDFFSQNFSNFFIWIKCMKHIVIGILLAAAAVAAHAQELKIAYVNSDRMLREAAPAKAAQAKLEAEFSKREKELADQATRLKAAGEKLDKEAPTLAETERTRRQRDLVEQDREFQRKRREFQDDLTQRKNEELASVVERANKVIKQIYETEKYDLIIQEAVFASPKVDITDKVIKSLNGQSAGAK